MVTVTRRDLLEHVRSVFGTLPPIERINRNKERERYWLWVILLLNVTAVADLRSYNSYASSKA